MAGAYAGTCRVRLGCLLHCLLCVALLEYWRRGQQGSSSVTPHGLNQRRAYTQQPWRCESSAVQQQSGQRRCGSSGKQ